MTAEECHAYLRTWAGILNLGIDPGTDDWDDYGPLKEQFISVWYARGYVSEQEANNLMQGVTTPCTLKDALIRAMRDPHSTIPPNQAECWERVVADYLVPLGLDPEVRRDQHPDITATDIMVALHGRERIPTKGYNEYIDRLYADFYGENKDITVCEIPAIVDHVLSLWPTPPYTDGQITPGQQAAAATRSPLAMVAAAAAAYFAIRTYL